MNKLSLLLTLISCFNLSFVSFSKAHNLSLNYQTEGCFTINTSGLIITPNTCGNKDGSVNGIAVNGEGKFTYAWKDSLSTVVGNGINLKDALAGTYKLEVRGADCVVQSISVTIDEIKTIVIDLSNVKIISAGCDNKGSVMGIKIYDATRVEWRSLITQTIVSNSADLVNLPVGIYKLTAYNATGCKKDAGTFNITSQTLIPRIENIDIEDPTCSESKGNVNIKLNILKEQENLSFTIVDSTGQVLESGAIVYNANFNIIDKNFRLPSGSFQMFVKGSSGCDILLTSFKLSKNELSLVSDSIGVFNDQCDQKIGRILGIKIKGLSKPPKGRIIKWTDSKGNPIGASVPFLLNIGAGIYTMHLTDPGGCELTATFTVLNEAPDLLPPKTRDVKICLPGKIQVITEAVALADSYKLYKASEENPIIIEENKDGKFSVTVNETTTFYVSYVQGICESSKTLLLVSVAAAGVIIPNTFTPNADGINDTWSIKAIENFPGSRIEIYNRYGNKVFNSIDYDKPFDGRKNDVDLPDGVYYYKIEIPELSCEGKVIGSLTILR